MPEYSKHQQNIIRRYYEQKDVILLERLQTLVTDLALAETEKKTASLWKRAEKAMDGLKVPPSIAAHILEKKDPETLAHHVRDWLTEARKG